jgi:hypothetical protein
MVLEVPPKVLGTANDMWQRWVVDVGITGPDKGRGGKYLFLPPGYKGSTPQDYYLNFACKYPRLKFESKLLRLT